jgi:hypothetical protein
MKRTVLYLSLLVFTVCMVVSADAQERSQRRRAPDTSVGRAVPRPPQAQRPPQRSPRVQRPPQRPYYIPPRLGQNWGFNFRFSYPRRPYYGYYGPRYYPRYVPRCVPGRWVFSGYDWYGYPVYNFVPGYCY